MRTMFKSLLEAILIGLILLSCVYCLIGFYSLSLNPKLWTEESRFVFSIIGFGILGMLILLFGIAIQSKNN